MPYYEVDGQKVEKEVALTMQMENGQNRFKKVAEKSDILWDNRNRRTIQPGSVVLNPWRRPRGKQEIIISVGTPGEPQGAQHFESMHGL
jgi:hypothetical protein